MGNQQTVQERAAEVFRSGSRMLAAGFGDRNRAPALSSTWSQVRENREGDDTDDNGFIFDGKYIPPELLELLLSFVPPKDILNLAQVSFRLFTENVKWLINMRF